MLLDYKLVKTLQADWEFLKTLKFFLIHGWTSCSRAFAPCTSFMLILQRWPDCGLRHTSPSEEEGCQPFYIWGEDACSCVKLRYGLSLRGFWWNICKQEGPSWQNDGWRKEHVAARNHLGSGAVSRFTGIRCCAAEAGLWVPANLSPACPLSCPSSSHQPCSHICLRSQCQQSALGNCTAAYYIGFARRLFKAPPLWFCIQLCETTRNEVIACLWSSGN